MGRAIASIEIEASPEKVFDFLLSDMGNDIMMEGVAEGKWTSEKPIGLGSTAHFIGIHKYNSGEEWNAEITEFTKNKSLTMLLKGANKKSLLRVFSVVVRLTCALSVIHVSHS